MLTPRAGTKKKQLRIWNGYHMEFAHVFRRNDVKLYRLLPSKSNKNINTKQKILLKYLSLADEMDGIGWVGMRYLWQDILMHTHAGCVREFTTLHGNGDGSIREIQICILFLLLAENIS